MIKKIGLNALVDADYRALISHITPFDPQNKNYLKKHNAQIHCTHHILLAINELICERQRALYGIKCVLRIF
jgi:hypothetical protein